jgi:hydroxymethylpyrimidine/phosphomethylpyrimidine kinase
MPKGPKPEGLRQVRSQIRRRASLRRARALTVAGSDSGGGAGIQADLKTFAALGVYGMSAITALTAQNTRGVLAVHPVPPDFVRAQIDAVADDIGFDAAKTGMLANAEIVSTVVDAMRAYRVRCLVVDPVMRAASGGRLLAPEAERMMVKRLLPLAFVVTPNAFEAAALSGIEVKTTADQEEAARRIAKLGPRAVLVKGGRTAGPSSVDVLYDGRRITRLRAKRISGPRGTATHGAGCTLSAAIAAHLALGAKLENAVSLAKRLVTQAIRRSVLIGHGIPPVGPPDAGPPFKRKP